MATPASGSCSVRPKGLGVITFLLFVNIILLVAGNFMEPSSIVLIFSPILFPVAMKLGIDQVHPCAQRGALKLELGLVLGHGRSRCP